RGGRRVCGLVPAGIEVDHRDAALVAGPLGVNPGEQPALVDPQWLAAHLDDPSVCVIEIAGLGQEEKRQAYNSGHIPGATCWEWKSMLWDSHARDFPSPDDFARRLGSAG